MAHADKVRPVISAAIALRDHVVGVLRWRQTAVTTDRITLEYFRAELTPERFPAAARCRLAIDHTRCTARLARPCLQLGVHSTVPLPM